MGKDKNLRGTFKRVAKKELTRKLSPSVSDVIADDFISAGWLLSQMDAAAGIRAFRYIGGKAVTVGIEAMSFKKPVFAGDDVSIYTEVVKTGTTSITVKLEAFAERRRGSKPEKVTEGLFTFVHIDENGKPKPIDEKKAKKAKKKDTTKRKKASTTEKREEEPELKEGQELSYRTMPMPRDKNHNGDIFGGWVLDQMDLAGAMRARKLIGGRAATVGLEAMTFHKPVAVHDQVSFYTDIVKVGNSSVTIRVESWALKDDLSRYEKVTEGEFTYVAVDRDHKPVPINNPKP